MENDLLSEGILDSIMQWAKGSHTSSDDKKKAASLAKFIADPKMQIKMQEVAIENLVKGFADSIKDIEDPKEKKKKIAKFYMTWKQKTNSSILASMLKKYNLI